MIDDKGALMYNSKMSQIPEEICNYHKDYQEFLASLRANNKKFYDVYFPPNKVSLGNSIAQRYSSIKWERLSEIS